VPAERNLINVISDKFIAGSAGQLNSLAVKNLGFDPMNIMGYNFIVWLESQMSTNAVLDTCTEVTTSCRAGGRGGHLNCNVLRVHDFLLWSFERMSRPLRC
jgi:hypothetical protein